MLELIPPILLGYIVLLAIPATRPYAMGPIALLPGVLTARRTAYPEHRPWAQLAPGDLPDRARTGVNAHADELQRRGFVLGAVCGQELQVTSPGPASRVWTAVYEHPSGIGILEVQYNEVAAMQASAMLVCACCRNGVIYGTTTHRMAPAWRQPAMQAIALPGERDVGTLLEVHTLLLRRRGAPLPAMSLEDFGGVEAYFRHCHERTMRAGIDGGFLRRNADGSVGHTWKGAWRTSWLTFWPGEAIERRLRLARSRRLRRELEGGQSPAP
jgi:hypothetical protein